MSIDLVIFIGAWVLLAAVVVAGRASTRRSRQRQAELARELDRWFSRRDPQETDHAE